MANNPAESECFGRLIEALKEAESCAKQMAAYRPDSADSWTRLSAAYEVCRQTTFELAMSAVQRRN